MANTNVDTPPSSSLQSSLRKISSHRRQPATAACDAGELEMSLLPDELWLRVLDIGVSTSRLTHRDLCRLAISCRSLRRLSGDLTIWSSLFSIDFPSSSSSSSSSEPPSKTLYRTRFERDKANRLAEWRRAVLRAESQVVACRNKLEALKTSLLQEDERLKAAVGELNNLENVRRASAALNIWQPEVVRGSQRQIVQQCTVPVESRLNVVKMEVRVCKQQLAVFNKAYNVQKQKLHEYKEALSSLKYHPLQSNLDSTIGTSSQAVLPSNTTSSDKKRKKLKQSNDGNKGKDQNLKRLSDYTPNSSLGNESK